MAASAAFAQNNTFLKPVSPIGFDEKKIIEEAKKEGVTEDKIQGYLNSRKAAYVQSHNADKKKTAFVNINGQNTYDLSSNYCPNTDFSMLNYSSWTGDIADNTEVTGLAFPSVTWSSTGINGNGGIPILMNTDPTSPNAFSDRQVIMSTSTGSLTNNPALAFSNGYDPVCQNAGTGLFDLPMVPPNGTTSLRLGSEYANQTVQKITYAIFVTPQNVQFTYQFAVVLNDGTSSGHGPGDQPAFVFQLKDGVGNQIGGSCGTYEQDAGHANADTTFILSSAPVATSFNGAPVYYRRWHTEIVDLTPFIGMTVYAEFQALDCTATIHFGYAYINAGCGPPMVNASGCMGTVTLSAPSGFASYQWYDANDVAITGADSAIHIANNVMPNDSFFVSMISIQGCTTKVKVIIQPCITNVTQVKEKSTEIYPNPSNGSFSINTSQNIDEVKITDVIGNVVYSAKCNSQKINLQLENAGVYFVTVTSGKESTVRKIIVNR